MATDFKMVHEFDCTPEELWELVESEEVDREMLEANDGEGEWLESTRGDTNTTRKQVRLSLDLPKAMTKVMGTNEISYILETRRPKGANEQDWTIEPNVLGDRFECYGTTRIEPTADGCRRVIDGRVSISVPFVGKKMEQRLVDTTKESYDKGATVLRRHIAEKS
jgi:hypothetical protein